MPSILFVCLGNICRSPCAEGVMAHFVQSKNLPFEVVVESCGLGDWHEGQLPDERMRDIAKGRGVILTSRARSFKHDFFDRFDYILAADHKVMYELHRWATTPEYKAKIHLITFFSSLFKDQDIPDPFYGEQVHFELVMDIIEDACTGLIEHLLAQEKRKNLSHE